MQEVNTDANIVERVNKHTWNLSAADLRNAIHLNHLQKRNYMQNLFKITSLN